MENSKYFTLGYPKDLRLPIYALYQPVFDCFLIVTDSDSMAQQLCTVLSSRYLCYPVCLSTAENYTKNLIDNTVCEKWTMHNSNEEIEVGNLKHDKIYYSAKLIEKENTSEWFKESEKQWCLLCLYYLRFLECFKDYLGITNSIKNWIPDEQFGKPQLYQPIHDAVLEVLYFERNFASAGEKIESIIASNDLADQIFKKAYNKWS